MSYKLINLFHNIIRKHQHLILKSLFQVLHTKLFSTLRNSFYFCRSSNDSHPFSRLLVGNLVYIRKWNTAAGARRDPFPFILVTRLFLRSTNLYFLRGRNEVEIVGCPGEDHPGVKITS